MTEIANYGKIEVEGPRAAEFLGHVMANRLPAVGKLALSPMLNEHGKLIGDFTISRHAEDKFLLVCSYVGGRLLSQLVRAAFAGGWRRLPRRLDGLSRACRSPGRSRANCCKS